jgi:phosphoribosylaminoimidazole-succinocarboxamide synthase
MLAESFLRSGKVRDIHQLADHRMLLIASDRISAFDVILPSLIPDKGRVLTGLSRFWFAETTSIIPNHLLATDVAVLGDAIRASLATTEHADADFGPLDDLRGRIMIAQPALVVPIEAVVRGYLSGSGWKEYQQTGMVCGNPLPSGLRECDRLPEPIFTPATKAEQGQHDENIDFDDMVEHIARADGVHQLRGVAASTMRARAYDQADAIRQRALALYRYGAAVTARRGIILADTKFEFGIPTSYGEVSDSWTYEFHDDEPPPSPGESLILIDEVMTPDSSRFWDAATYEPGRPQASFDKQFVRDWLEAQPWDKTDPGPALPPEVIEGTRARYIEAYERITGASFERYLREDVIAP